LTTQAAEAAGSSGGMAAAPNAEEFEEELDRVPECDLVMAVVKLHDLDGVDGVNPDSNCSNLPGLVFMWDSYASHLLYQRIDAHAIEACFEQWISDCEILEREQMVQPCPMQKNAHEIISNFKQAMRIVLQKLRAKNLQPVAHTMLETLLNGMSEIMEIVTLSTSMAGRKATDDDAHKYLKRCEVMIKLWKNGHRCLLRQREVSDKVLHSAHLENQKLLLEQLSGPSAREAQLAAENARLQEALLAASARGAEQEAAKARLQERVLELEHTQAMYDALTDLFDGQKAQKRKHRGGAGEAAEAAEAGETAAAETAAAAEAAAEAGFEAGEAAL
jgi:hypothetical protein